MTLKSVIPFAFILLHISYVELEDDFEKYASIVAAYGDLSACNKTYCDTPCIGAAPPAVCPDMVPNCASGCACMLDCEHKLTFCFETKDCLEKRLYFTGKKKKNTRKDTSKKFL